MSMFINDLGEPLLTNQCNFFVRACFVTEFTMPFAYFVFEFFGCYEVYVIPFFCQLSQSSSSSLRPQWDPSSLSMLYNVLSDSLVCFVLNIWKRSNVSLEIEFLCLVNVMFSSCIISFVVHRSLLV